MQPCGLQLARLLSMGILQARILEWVAVPSSRGPSRPGEGILVSYISPALAGGFFTTGTTWEAFISLKPFFLLERGFCPLLPKDSWLKVVSAPFTGRKQTQKLNLLLVLPSGLTGIVVYIPLAPVCAKCVGSHCHSWATADGYHAVGID